MKIAQVVCVSPVEKSGMANAAYNFAKMAAEHGHESVLICPWDKKSRMAPSNSIEIIGLKPWLNAGHGAFMPQSFFYLDKFDIIHLHYPFFGGAEIIWFYSFFKKRKSKIIIHYHMDTHGLRALYQFFSL